MPETPSAPIPETAVVFDPSASTVIPDGATLPPGVPEPAPAAECDAKVGGLNAATCAPDPRWERRQAVREELEDLAADVLKRALKGELPDSPHARQQIDAALSIVKRY